MRIAIIVLNFNGWDDTRLCLRSLADLNTPATIVLVDNASTDDRLAEFRQEFPRIHTLRNAVNGGWAGGNNTGIRYALDRGADWLLLLNNDTTVAPQLIDSLLAAARAHPTFGILGPVIAFMDEPDTVMTDGCNFNHPAREGFFQRQPVELTEPPALAEVEIVNGCAMMLSANVPRTIGLIDERFFLIHEESDYCLRARAAGFRCGVVGSTLVWHKGSSSFKRSGRKMQRYYDARNLFLLLDKHVDDHPPGRNWLSSMTTYLRYVYHRYCLERENGSQESADAVVNGLCDALAGNFGAMSERTRWGSQLVRKLFETARRLRTSGEPAPVRGRSE
ncbi:MAG: glycosyltransferase family 2 protein [Planctomycetes bacterium]|nr:glycosyltransferase family 2 protein [Planctomycetota bacterium]